MSDFGAVYEYALMLEASLPAAEMAKMEAVRPACMGAPGKRNPEPPPPSKAELEATTQAEWQAAREAASAGAPASAATPSTPAPHPASHPAAAADDKKK